jgi:hypothetical protein
MLQHTVRKTPLDGKPQTLKAPLLHLQHSIPTNVHGLCPVTQTWGHTLTPIDTTKTFRILLQNPNGLRIQKSIADLTLGHQICRSLETGAIAFAETNVNWNQQYQYHRVTQSLRDHWETTSFQVSQHPEVSKSQNQRGGTLQVLTDRWVSRIQSKGEDPYGMGRWSYMILTSKGSKTTVLITAYRPCSNSPRSAGDKTVYMQQFRTLLAHATSIESTSTPDPHRQFILAIQALISHLQEQGHSIILCLDCNENLNRPLRPARIQQWLLHPIGNPFWYSLKHGNYVWSY